MDLGDCINSWYLPDDLYSIIFTLFTICSRIKLWAAENPVAIFSRGRFDRQCQVFTKLLGGKKSRLARKGKYPVARLKVRNLML